MFAIQIPDPKIGRIIANQVAWGREKDKVRTKIELVDCSTLLPEGKNAGKNNNKFFSIEQLAKLGRGNIKFLCPIDIKQMKLGGNIGSREFNYVEIKLLGCNETVCVPEKDIMDTSINFVGLKAVPNLIQGEQDVVKYTQDFTYFKFLDPTNR